MYIFLKTSNQNSTGISRLKLLLKINFTVFNSFFITSVANDDIKWRIICVDILHDLIGQYLFLVVQNFWIRWIKILEKQTSSINASRVITGTWSLDIIGKKLQSSVHKSVQNHELETFYNTRTWPAVNWGRSLGKKTNSADANDGVDCAWLPILPFFRIFLPWLHVYFRAKKCIQFSRNLRKNLSSDSVKSPWNDYSCLKANS